MKNNDKIYLGKIEGYGNIYLFKHSWDCGWYWSIGYLGNDNCHFHMKNLIKDSEDNVHKAFTKTSITQKQWYVICDLFTQAYALKKTAETYRHGGHISSLIGVTNCIQNKEMEIKINSDLSKLLDVTWNYLLEELK